MKFGSVAVQDAEGHILAHSVSLQSGRLKKGQTLTSANVEQLAKAGIAEVLVAALEPQDIHENEAAARIAAALALNAEALSLSVTAPFTGRVNLFAEATGVLVLDTDRVASLNAIDEAITIATLPDRCRVAPRQMVATVKIIPYAAPELAVAQAERALLAAGDVIKVAPVQLRSADLILTRTVGMSDKALRKGADAVRARLEALGVELRSEQVVPHEIDAVVTALGQTCADLALVLTGSATSDPADVGPAALRQAGGRLETVGMPVDPGNLLFLGALGERPVIGLPGCARSPKLNGADWVLERVVCGMAPTRAEIAAMGVGGLLKEIPSRPSPRTGADATGRRPLVSALVLAAGESSRMRGRDKLLEPIGAGTSLTRAIDAASKAADEVLVVTRPTDPERQKLVAASGARVVPNPRASEGMGASIAVGLEAVDPRADAVIILLGDMPEINGGDLNSLIAAFDPEEGRAIIRATDPEGRPGHPVLFGRRFFEPLRALHGEQGARELLQDYPEFVTEVRLADSRAIIDLDTPEDWENWRKRSGFAR